MNSFFLRGFSILAFCFSSIDCGVALTSGRTIKIPPKMSIEVFRLNLLEGEAKDIYGLNVGLFNSVRHHLIGAQIGIINEADDATGAQIGIVNNSNPTYGALKIGLFNFNFSLDRGMPRPGPYEGYDQEQENKSRDRKNFGLSIGAANVMSGRFNLGLFNWGEGLNVGLINLNEGSSVSLGIVNIGTNLEVSPKEKRAISFGIFNAGSHKEEFQIGIVNYCPNNTIPIMIIANYCSKPKPETPSSTPKTEQKTEKLPQSVE